MSLSHSVLDDQQVGLFIMPAAVNVTVLSQKDGQNFINKFHKIKWRRENLKMKSFMRDVSRQDTELFPSLFDR